MASLDVKTALILTLTGVHGHLTAALLAEIQDVRWSAEAPVLWGRIAKYVFGKRRRSGELGGQHDTEYTLRGMMWADNYWLLALRSILGWETTAWWRSRSSWGMTWDPYNVQRWKHKVGFHNRGVQWDTPMARWVGEGKDWIQHRTQTQPRKEDDIRNLLESMRQPVDKKKEFKGSVPTKKPRDLPPLDLGTPVPGEKPILEINEQ